MTDTSGTAGTAGVTGTPASELSWEPDRLLAGFEAATLLTGGPPPAARNGLLSLVPPLPRRTASAATDRDADPGAATVPEAVPA
ncbi:hypothetical protein ACFRCR_10230, partial [Oerskovia sp. NPDC056781]|uniref:hypothetical protein n=1 Tax=Oerskovia sp. NPDC056781 TaxID=3345942 RepID=UPI00366CF164